MEIPLAYGVTPLTVNASAGTARGPRTPFGPERERTIVTPPEENPETCRQLADTKERRDVTTGRPTRGSNHSTTDENLHPGWFMQHGDAGIVTSTTTDSVSQSTPTSVPDGDATHWSREARRVWCGSKRTSMVRTQLMVCMM